MAMNPQDVVHTACAKRITVQYMLCLGILNDRDTLLNRSHYIRLLEQLILDGFRGAGGHAECEARL